MSWPLMVGFALVAIAAPVVLAVWWLRRRAMPTRPAVAIPVVVGLVLAGQVGAIGAIAIYANRSFGLYQTWESVGSIFQRQDVPDVPVSEVTMMPPTTRSLPTGPASATPTAPPSTAASAAPAAKYRPASAGDGKYVSYQVPGPASGAAPQKVIVWLPPGYEDGKELQNLPVMLIVTGAYEPLDQYMKWLAPSDWGGPAVRSGAVAPFVAVIPNANLLLPQDNECTDSPGDPQMYTWLSKDVPDWMKNTLGVTKDHRLWSVQGWSSGGYCAAKLHVANPDKFAVGGVYAGYFEPKPDGSTGALAKTLAKDANLRNLSSVTWLMRNQRPANLNLVVGWSEADPQSVKESKLFLKEFGGVPGVTSKLFPGLGHNILAWKQMVTDTLPSLVPPRN